MTLPAGVTVQGIVQAVRPGAYEKATVDEWFEGNGFGRIVDGQEELSPPTRVLRMGKLDWTPAWLSALTHLAEVDPEAVVKAVWPEAVCEREWDKHTDRFYCWLESDENARPPVLLSGDSCFDSAHSTWLSAARKIVKDMKGEGR